MEGRMSGCGYGLEHSIVPPRLRVVGSGVCRGYGGITERSPDQYRLRERHGGLVKKLKLSLWGSGLSVMLRMEPEVSCRLRTHFATEPAPRNISQLSS